MDHYNENFISLGLDGTLEPGIESFSHFPSSIKRTITFSGVLLLVHTPTYCLGMNILMVKRVRLLQGTCHQLFHHRMTSVYVEHFLLCYIEIENNSSSSMKIKEKKFYFWKMNIFVFLYLFLTIRSFSYISHWKSYNSVNVIYIFEVVYWGQNSSQRPCVLFC